MEICGIKGCDSAVLALGMCNKHYQRNRKFGSPLAVKSHNWSMRGLSAEERFQRQFKVVGDCWIWTASTDKDGYGIFNGTFDDVLYKRAHRFSWAFYNKQQIPKGMLACHKCDVPRCVNPDHLFIGTEGDNTRDMISKNRHNVPRGDLAYKSILVESQALAILADPRPYTQIAADYGVAATTIGSIKTRVSWSHLEVDFVAHAPRVSPRRGKSEKITEEIVREIRSSHSSGKDLAAKYDISPQLVCGIRKRRNWAHIE